MTVRFNLEDAQRASDEWGANCGPGAIAGVMGMTLEEVRPHMGDFENKGYTNPTLMWQVLRSIGRPWRLTKPPRSWPNFGLTRVQWEGPWTEPGVPIRVRYRHSHWVGARRRQNDIEIFDINAMCVGGWLSLDKWAGDLVPWLLRECVPKADGRWHLTHVVEVE